MRVKVRGKLVSCRTVDFDEVRNRVLLIEQRLLPHKFQIISTSGYQETARAIQEMVVRGAGAIGATAAFGFAQGMRAFRGKSQRLWQKHVLRVYNTLKAARPTAIDPVNAMNRILSSIRAGSSIEEQQDLALRMARDFAEEDVAHCRAIGEHGAGLIQDGMRILTHCNAGWLAFVDIGSATAPLYAARDQRKTFHVYCDETRPRCQGATLTAWELHQESISHQVIADNAAGFMMARGMIDMVIVGSDRVVGRTGEVANKIGTYTKAVLAHRHRIPFYVAHPLSTIDWTVGSGEDIPIEEREGSEVLGAWGTNASGNRQYVRVANPGSLAFNPGFDVTPPEMITGLITPRGIVRPAALWRERANYGYVEGT